MASDCYFENICLCSQIYREFRNDILKSYNLLRFYESVKNSTVLPNGYLRGIDGAIVITAGHLINYSDYNQNSLEEFYADWGCFLGHEMSHIFDSYFIKVMKDWKKDEFEEYIDWENGIIELIEKEAQAYDLSFTGNHVIAEQIADLFGVHIAIESLKKHKSNPDFKKFFIYYAQQHRFYYTDDYLERNMDKRTHNLENFSVNLVCKTLPEFYDAFNIQPGDKMYVTPEERIKLW